MSVWYGKDVRVSVLKSEYDSLLSELEALRNRVAVLEGELNSTQQFLKDAYAALPDMNIVGWPTLAELIKSETEEKEALKAKVAALEKELNKSHER